MPSPSYTRLDFDERRRRLVDTAAELFTEHSYEELSMRQIAAAAGISKSLLYHYFPTKSELFRTAVAERAQELRAAIEPRGEAPLQEQLGASLDAYLGWIERNGRTWSKLMASAAVLPEAGEVVEAFRRETLARVSEAVTGAPEPPPALRVALLGWLGFLDAAVLDWVAHGDLAREQLRELLLSAFAATLGAVAGLPAPGLR
jgi:AcrR family transcriptional regulator